jgi:hypothetical protein
MYAGTGRRSIYSTSKTRLPLETALANGLQLTSHNFPPKPLRTSPPSRRRTAPKQSIETTSAFHTPPDTNIHKTFTCHPSPRPPSRATHAFNHPLSLDIPGARGARRPLSCRHLTRHH